MARKIVSARKAPVLTPAQKAARTRKRLGIGSDAARKAWATRRAMAAQIAPAPVMNAAHKAWATRRALSEAKPSHASEFALIIASLRRIERALAI